MLLVFLYISVFEYILSLPQLVQSLVHESMSSREKYWTYKTLWKPYEDTENHKKILSKFLSTMSELESLRTDVVTVSNYFDSFFMSDYYSDMFSQRSSPSWITTRFRKRGQVITRFPYRQKPRIPSYRGTESLRHNLHTKIISNNNVNYEENHKYEYFWPRQHLISKHVTPLQRTSIVKYSQHNLNYRPQIRRNYESPRFRSVLIKPNQSFILANKINNPSQRRQRQGVIPLERKQIILPFTINTETWTFPPTPLLTLEMPAMRPTVSENVYSPTMSPTSTSADTEDNSKTPALDTGPFTFPPTPTLNFDETIITATAASTTEIDQSITPEKTEISSQSLSSADLETQTVTTEEFKLTSAPSPISHSTTVNTNGDSETSTKVTSKSTSKSTPKPVMKAYCYMCGLNETEIPRAPTCYQAFDTTVKSRKSSNIRYYKVHCSTKKTHRRSNKNEFVGDLYREGCFKRFTDIGMVYNERGCRTMKPTKGKSFASNRFVKLELLLKDQDEGCVESPHASLTPFSRAVSLFVRYHVCVCRGRYCNRTTRVSEPPFATLHLILITHYLLYLCKCN